MMILTKHETLGTDKSGVRMQLIADASQTGGTATLQRVFLASNEPGASPHVHAYSFEAFFLQSGSMFFLEGECINEVRAGDVVLVPPGVHHAFAAGPCGAEANIVLTPGVERFDYFRLLAEVMEGRRPVGQLKEAGYIYDNVLVESANWEHFLLDHAITGERTEQM